MICSHIPGLWWKNCASYHKDTCTKYIKVHQIYHLNHLWCRLRIHKVAVYGLAHSVRLKEMKGQSVSLCFHEHDWKHAILCSYHLPSLSAQILWTHTTQQASVNFQALASPSYVDFVSQHIIGKRPKKTHFINCHHMKSSWSSCVWMLSSTAPHKYSLWRKWKPECQASKKWRNRQNDKCSRNSGAKCESSWITAMAFPPWQFCDSVKKHEKTFQSTEHSGYPHKCLLHGQLLPFESSALWRQRKTAQEEINTNGVFFADQLSKSMLLLLYPLAILFDSYGTSKLSIRVKHGKTI